MLCPEVWKFSAPESNFKETSGHFLPTSGNKLYIPPPLDDFYYTHLVSVVLPNALSLPTNICDSLSSDSDYYKVTNLSLSELIREEFIEHFIKRGSLTALSIDRRIDIDNCACITPDGSLIVTLDRKSYQQLGLEGKVSHFTSSLTDRYIVRLNLKHDSFTGNRKLYDRTIHCLTERLETFTFILSWTPDDAKLCPSSVAKYLSDRGCSVVLCSTQCVRRCEENVRVPSIHEQSAMFSADEFVEWLGMFSLKADMDADAFDTYINTYETPTDAVLTKRVQYIQWRGLFTSQQVRKLYEQLAIYVRSASGKSPWVSLYVQGFSDVPIAWKHQEHHYYTNGDNAHVAVLQPNGKYLFCTQSCSRKKYK
ncbi:hypothetical protein CBL_06768 [Carabus blaptoides fortunei]